MWYLVVLASHLWGSPSVVQLGSYANEPACEAKAQELNDHIGAGYMVTCVRQDAGKP